MRLFALILERPLNARLRSAEYFKKLRRFPSSRSKMAAGFTLRDWHGRCYLEKSWRNEYERE